MATIDLLRRRRQMMAQGDDPYEGWLWNKDFQIRGAIIDREGWCISPYFQVTGGHRITFYYSAPKEGGRDIVEIYDANHKWIDFFVRNQDNSRTVLMLANAAIIQFAMPIDNLNNCYVLDVTDNVYIWKGKNV